MKILVLCHGCGNDSSTTGKPDDCVDCLKRDRILLARLSADISNVSAVLDLGDVIALRDRVLREANRA